jgi:hypothetical protein
MLSSFYLNKKLECISRKLNYDDFTDVLVTRLLNDLVAC